MQYRAVQCDFLQMMCGAALAAGQHHRDLLEQLRSFVDVQIEQPGREEQGVYAGKTGGDVLTVQAVILADQLQRHAVKQPAKNFIHRGVEFQRGELAHDFTAVEAAFADDFAEGAVFDRHRLRFARRA
ncbi:hypothetical protein D3C73_1204190 [compost metagenome]